MNAQQIADGTWAHLWTPGGWGQTNTGLIVDDGAASMVIDTVWDTGRADAIASENRSLTRRSPVADVVNTHSDGDHWWGNDTVPSDARIITSAASLHAMKEETPPSGVHLFASLGALAGRLPGPVGATGTYMDRVRGGATFPRTSPRLPNHTFDVTERIDVGTRAVQLRYLGPAHTAGDLIAHVPDVGVVFSGDLLFIGSTPILWHGPLSNWIDALDHLLALDAAVYVPGHGPLCGADEIRAVREYWTWVDDAGRQHFDAGVEYAHAARNMMQSRDFQPYQAWGSPERLVLTMSTLYRLWKGEPAAPPTLLRRARAFADAGALLRAIESR
ncbi:MBL fold metallo-hydrolase [Rhodococcus sp. 114MFTsu3.1]|uniref:MBL fold metallo-hydrolase n=1 Tax=Rhodococcus sp. 114MFTsu3.1 TaxID=1172184 RepID=UPI0003694FDE|nr:MBL fold metallo-hydrolase [Rhodococcus sp. 114MFTsu3.1]